MWNPFKHKHTKSFHFDFNTFNQFYQYSLTVESRATVLLHNLDEEAELVRYEFPYAHQHDQANTRFLQKNKYKNYYELLNALYAKANITPVYVADSIEKEYQYDILLFNFFTPAPEQQKGLLKSIKHTFYVFLVSEQGSEALNAYRTLYATGLNYGVEDLLNAQFIEDINEPATEIQSAVAQLEQVVAAFAQELQLPINAALAKKYPQASMSRQVTLQECKALLGALNYRELEDLDNKAENLFIQYQQSREDQIAALEERQREEDEEYEYYDDGFFPLRFELISDDNSFFFDWKFDPEDIKDIISSLLKETWTFDYPDETYSHDLFLYVQKKLAERGLIPMNMNTLGDDYNFFLAKREDVELILHLSKKMRLGIEQLI